MRSSVRALAIGAAKGAAIGDGALKIQTHAGGPQGRHFLALPTTLHIPDHP